MVKLKRLVDDLLQNWYRAKYPDKKCEVCKGQFQLMHHHVEKSKSNFLRYGDKDNLIFMCKACHNKIHFDDHNVVSNYTLGRGKQWLDRIKRKSLIHISLTIPYLTKMKEKYEQVASKKHF